MRRSSEGGCEESIRGRVWEGIRGGLSEEGVRRALEGVRRALEGGCEEVIRGGCEEGIRGRV